MTNREQRWHVYLLLCGDDSLYCGITTDLTRRVRQHNAGTASKCTRARLPVKLVWSEPAAGRSEALRREAAIKKLSRTEKWKLIKEVRACQLADG